MHFRIVDKQPPFEWPPQSRAELAPPNHPRLSEIVYLCAAFPATNFLSGASVSFMKPIFHRLLLFLLFAWPILPGCSGRGRVPENDVELARVYNKTLLLSATGHVVPEGTPPDDSVLMLRAYVQRWVYDQLLMYEAERNIPQDLNIDQLVRDYRASLVRFNFEQRIIAEQLDSTIAESELQSFYENNKDQFQLENTILKCLLIKVPKDAPVSELNKMWYSRNDRERAGMQAFCDKWAVLAFLDPEKWYKIEEVAAILPQGTLTAQNAAPNREGALSDGDFRYYYRVLETVKSKETAPLEFVREQASKVILHLRKQKLLEAWKEQLYQKELRRENIKLN
ncbi:MAG: peptidylprolyl isomerase [Saprospiraceae bacterium]|nr:peptidylprolyl isomerase [Saprospiraceae bacterium]